MKDAPYGIRPDVMDTYVKSCGQLWCGGLLIELHVS